MRLAYADPPYLGCCSYYGHNHDTWGCWDDVQTHQHLIDTLTEYDGWAYSASSPSLPDILSLPLRHPYRIAAWVKPFASFKPTQRVAYAWEPVIFKSARGRDDGAVPMRDWLSERITLEKGLTGAKPERFCRWIADLLGYVAGDEIVDIFPGTGIMERVLAQGTLL